MTAHRRLLLAVAIALAACNTRDAETDEAAIAADSAAASAPIIAPSDSGRSADSGARFPTPPRPLDVNPSVPRGRGPGSGSMPSAVPDTLRGVIALVGADPMVRVILRGDPRGPVTLIGAPALAGLSGLELWVAGSRREGAFEVSEFAVRAADGVPAVDGVLTDREGRLSLVRGGGTTEIARAPSAIRSLIGKRIWVTMASGEVHTFGVIEPPR